MIETLMAMGFAFTSGYLFVERATRRQHEMDLLVFCNNKIASVTKEKEALRSRVKKMQEAYDATVGIGSILYNMEVALDFVHIPQNVHMYGRDAAINISKRLNSFECTAQRLYLYDRDSK